YRTLAEIQDKAQNCSRAIQAYEQALRVYTLDRFPMDYAMTQNNLGTAYRTLAEIQDKAQNCSRAIQAYEQALKVFREDLFPEVYPIVARNLARCLQFCQGE
ncbi:MAG: hypothetical protein QHH80_14590, partial [Anaerolineae bacterium]|nr:hypothetical protein [Anaerolineae bacterium]